MKKQSIKKHVAFIIAIMMFSAIPTMVNAQQGRSGPKKCHSCPGRCYCISGYCYCPVTFLTNSSPSNETLSISSADPNAISFQLMQAQNVSANIYDATGRLVRTIANGKMSEGYHQIEWNNKYETGKAVPAGIYILQVVTNGRSETKKLSVMK